MEGRGESQLLCVRWLLRAALRATTSVAQTLFWALLRWLLSLACMQPLLHRLLHLVAATTAAWSGGLCSCALSLRFSILSQPRAVMPSLTGRLPLLASMPSRPWLLQTLALWTRCLRRAHFPLRRVLYASG